MNDRAKPAPLAGRGATMRHPGVMPHLDTSPSKWDT